MYKKQMKFQKFICYLQLIASALIFVYSLGLATDLYDSLYFMIPDPTDYSTAYVPGAQILYDIQPFNKMLTVVGLVLILLAVFMMVMNTHTRRKYYVGNYIAIALSAVASLGASVWGVMNCMTFKNQFLTTVDFESLKMWSEIWKTPYTESTFWFDVSLVVFGLMVVSTVLLICNLIWKTKMTKEEAKLIAAGKEVA